MIFRVFPFLKPNIKKKVGILDLETPCIIIDYYCKRTDHVSFTIIEERGFFLVGTSLTLYIEKQNKNLFIYNFVRLTPLYK